MYGIHDNGLVQGTVTTLSAQKIEIIYFISGIAYPLSGESLQTARNRAHDYFSKLFFEYTKSLSHDVNDIGVKHELTLIDSENNSLYFVLAVTILPTFNCSVYYKETDGIKYYVRSSSSNKVAEGETLKKLQSRLFPSDTARPTRKHSF